MSDLLKKNCLPCEGGVIPFDISEIHKYQKKVDGWNILKNKKKIYFLNKKCVPCEGGVLPFDISEIHKYQTKVDGWDILKDEKKIFF